MTAWQAGGRGPPHKVGQGEVVGLGVAGFFRGWRGARLHRMGENAQRMPVSDERAINAELGIEALAVNSSLFGWCNRPRLLWPDWIPRSGDGLWLERSKSGAEFRWSLRGAADRGSIDRWLRKGSKWLGEKEDPPRCILTLMR